MADCALTYKATLFDTIFQGYDGPAFSVRMWGGRQWSSPHCQVPACTIVVKRPEALAALIAHPNELSLGEAFIHDDLDVEGDLFSVFAIAEYLFNRPHTLMQQLIEKSART